MSNCRPIILTLIMPLLVPLPSWAQETARRVLHDGSAVVRQKDGDNEALIRILCDEASLPEAGFTTEANRVTRAETGRSNMVSLRLRPWQDTDDVLITSNWGVAWIPRPISTGGVLTMEVEVRPPTVMRDGSPVGVTYDMWKAGDVPDERRVIEFQANCSGPDPDAPAFRTLPR